MRVELVGTEGNYSSCTRVQFLGLNVIIIFLDVDTM
jgi:hypothetical protein